MITPLEKAMQRVTQGEPIVQECATCAKCVKVGNVFYCEVSGKVLLNCFMQIGRCMHSPSNYTRKE